MNFEEFKEELTKEIGKELYERGVGDCELETKKMDKMNTSYEALTIKPEGASVGISLNVDELYKNYDNGKSFGSIVKHVAELAVARLEEAPNFDVDSFNDYNKMKHTLSMEVVSTERNAEILQNVPHKDIEDMAVVYRFQVVSEGADVGSILVTNQMLDNYGISAEQLHEDAVRNAPEIKPLVIQGMGEVLAKQMGVEDLEMLGLNIPPEQEQMFVASVEGNVHGAGVIAYEDFMEKASERVGGSFFILPSSIHEILIIPDNGNFDLKTLENMVREVNATTVDPADKLTDSVYHYDSNNKVFELGEKFVERQNGIVEERGCDSKEKKSLLGELKAAKEEASKTPMNNSLDKGHKEKGGNVI